MALPTALKQEATKTTKKFKEGAKKILETFGLGFIVQGIPGIGILADFSFPNARLVLRQTKENRTAPDGLLMLAVALLFDVTKLAVAITELLVADTDFTIVSTIIAWMSWGVFGLWIYLRSGNLLGMPTKDEEEKESNQENNRSEGETIEKPQSKPSTSQINAKTVPGDANPQTPKISAPVGKK
jgi:hypothetical protein